MMLTITRRLWISVLAVLTIASCTSSGTMDSGQERTDTSVDASVADAAGADASAGPDGAGSDAASYTDGLADSDTGRNACVSSGQYQRGCACTDAATVLVTACGPGAESPCYIYGNSCIDPGFLECRSSNYASHPDLRARCEAFCSEVMRQDASGGCSVGN